MFREFLNQHRLDDLLCAPDAFRPFPLCFERSAWETLPGSTKAILLNWGEKALQGYPQLKATQFMAYSRTGERKVFETPYFSRRTLLFGATLAECVENRGRFVDAVIDGLWCICEETSWVVSAHNNRHSDDMYPFMHRCLPDETDPYIDLFAAETAAVLAYVLYFMADKLDAVSPLVTSRVRREVERRIFHPFLTHNDFWWMGFSSKKVNNWNPWILSNIIDTALLMEKDVVRRNELLTRAMIMLDTYLAIMPEDGGCDEGAGYFNVAGASLLDCLESLHCASNGKIDFYHEPHIAAIGSYPEKVHIGGSYYLNFADCDAKPILDYERLYTYGKRVGNQRLMELGAAMYGAMPEESRILIRDVPQVNRVLFSLFSDLGTKIPEPAPARFMQMPDLQVFSWYKDGLYAAIKGGHNDESHNHNDVGTWMLYADGEPEIIDMGNKVYTAATFGPHRYELNNTRSRNHNVPQIGGMEQHAGREYAACDVHADENGASMELAGAYPAAAGVERLHRSFAVADGRITLCDAVELADEKSITWVFMLRNKPTVAKGEVCFGKLKLVFDEDLLAEVEEIPVDDDRMKRSFEGSLWRLAIRASEALKQHRTFIVTRA